MGFYTESMFKVGQEVQFMYNGKMRRGVIESTYNSFLILTNMVGEQPSAYKSFSYNKMGEMTWYGDVVAA